MAARRAGMPVGRIGGLTLGRLVCGSNLISMNMHARDLDYMASLARHYNTKGRVLSNHDEYHDNMFCHAPERTIAFMQDVKVPWIAFKVMAAGAIRPEDGFRGGADFLCVGMFDFQVEEDAALVGKLAAEAKHRPRRWA